MQNKKNNTYQSASKRIILVALFFMTFGTASELYLLNHYESVLQLIPLLCIGVLILLMCILFFRQTALVMGLFKLVLAITALSGFYGTFLHLRANYEFEQEMKPTAKGWDLFLESVSGALPALAPGSMIVLALIGYLYIIFLKQKQ